jgi:hypothetical protein
MANGGFDNRANSTCMDWSTMSATAARRAKRKHTMVCLKVGLKQQQQQIIELNQRVSMYTGSWPIDALLQSISVHTADCLALGTNVHFASAAFCTSRALGFKSKQRHKQHLAYHRRANEVKHNVLDYAHMLGDLPAMPVGIFCDDFGSYLLNAYASQQPSDKDGQTSGHCGWCGLWQPLLLKQPVRFTAVGNMSTPEFSNYAEAASESAAACNATADIAEAVATTTVAGSTGELAEALHPDSTASQASIATASAQRDLENASTPHTSPRAEEVAAASRPVHALPNYGFLTVGDACRAVTVSWSFYGLMAPGLADLFEATGGSLSQTQRINGVGCASNM